MRRLRREVECIVGPLHASEWRKNRMREELLGHLSKLFDEELASLRDENRALDAARARFGDAAEIARTLQESVPWIERILWLRVPGGTWAQRRAGESAIGHILRVARWQLAWLAIVNVMSVIAIVAIGQFINRRPLPERPPLVNVVTFLALFTLVHAAFVFAMPLCSELLRRHATFYRRATGTGRRRHGSLVIGVVVLMAALGAGGAAAVAALFESLLRIPIVDAKSFWLVVVIAGLVTLPLAIIHAWEHANRTRRFEDCYAGDFEAAQ